MLLWTVQVGRPHPPADPGSLSTCYSHLSGHHGHSILVNPTRGLRSLCPVLLAWVSLSKHLVSSDSKFARVVQPRPACDLNVKGERNRKKATGLYLGPDTTASGEGTGAPLLQISPS